MQRSPVDANPAATTLDYAPAVHPPRRIWHVGTLTYTGPQLANVFFWMLWGDFCLNLMDSGVGTSLVLLQLKRYGASNTTIGFVQGTAIEVLAIVMVAVISTWSDRHRGRLGRRMPFMLHTALPIAIFLSLMGFSGHIAPRVAHLFPRLFAHVAETSLIVGVIVVTFVGYKFFDMFPQSVYYYLFADVIPHTVMGTFSCLFRVFSTLGSMAFSLFLLPHCQENPHVVCLIAAGLYLFAFVMLSLMVKEGEYPPPPVVPTRPGQSWFARSFERIAQYCREMFLHPYYWTFYLFQLFLWVGVRGYGQFLLPYATETVKMSVTTYGRIETAIGGVVLGVYFLMGPVIDRFHPIRVCLAGFALVCVVAVFAYFGIHDVTTYAVWVGLLRVAAAIYQGANIALLPRLLPRQQYGQFCSANAIVFHLGLAAGLPLCGWMLDVTHNDALIFLWFFAFSVAAIAMLGLLYRQWKTLGGDEHYAPPVTAPGAAIEVEDAAVVTA